MSKASPSLTALPPQVTSSLARLGEHLALARVRRKESQRQWAERIGISVPTLVRMERGDPGVSMGIYATALWMMGRSNQLAELADPVHDVGALELDIRGATRRRAVRTAASVQAKLGRDRAKTS
ncbi:helix-turn-helix domain-containing protein [Pigmentiphaga litoralis]|jgi:DNA-binding XRE family transcriptional regulator|uniref:helix-turn-helix domain-containing protein n=1 Tax=Pigmentiphaga litoralis TaxID=516702 RepID=UPI00167B7816|nr:helix-turn-helix transcriptional regulator [Pigmentiphaga litoralis]